MASLSLPHFACVACRSQKAPKVTLDLDNHYGRFCPKRKMEEKNARLAVLDNFKEISRIMTQNFLTHKKLEKRYEKTAIPKTELQKMKQEEDIGTVFPPAARLNPISQSLNLAGTSASRSLLPDRAWNGSVADYVDS